MFPMMHSRLLLICCVVYSVICLSSAGPYCKGQYETPVECIDQCQTCEYKNGGCAQPAVCIEGCDCIPGFFRNKQNQCIPAAFCPAVCGPNSKPSDCVFCEPTCRNPKPQVCAQSCTAGCACDDGFLKDDNGNCIPKNECPIVCGPNSKPSDCVSLCEPTCRKRKPGFCPQACTRGCACDDGFLKDDNGNCVPENKCPNQCKSDEQYYPDIPDCKNTCENYNNPGAICPQYFAPRPGCFCATGLVKRQDGKCVKPEYCFPPGPPQQCPPGEFPVECIDRCQRCEYKNGNCSQILICTPGCNCVPGFLRDSTNKCIPADFCPGTGPGPAQQCPAGEYPVECVDRCQRCEYKNGNCGQGQACTPGCNCVPGFLRDKTNKCIPADFCPDQCKSDEQYYSDIPDCKNTCENYNNPGAICPQYFAARPGCFCAIGLVKRKDGKCVKPENCFPPGFPCSLEVDAGPCYGYFPRFYFNKKTEQCEKFIYGGCKGNANNFEDKKICEIVCKGPGPGPAQQCPAGEIPVGCIDRCQRCEYKNGNCAQVQVCTPGCNCAPGFLRDSTNKCIPANFCPDQCKSDEEYYPDIPDCKNTCEYINNPGTICPQYFAPRPGCFCKKGLVKRKDGKCVRPENCGPPPGFPCSLEVDAGPCYGYFPRFYFNKKTGQCEEFIYGGCKGNANNFEDKKICEIVCKGPPRPQQCPSGEIPGCIDGCQRCEYKNGNCSQIQVCTPGCNCVPGFLRDSTNKCIPADFCPGPPRPQQCPSGEIPGCIDGCQRCEYKNGNCSQIQVCTPGCNCVPGFLRDSTNKCIPADFCPGNNPNKPCLQEKDPGPCRAYIKRFYYNKKTGQCEEFIYGGCEGNANNFEDKKLCEIVCKGPGPTQQCGQYERPVECIDQCQTCEYRNGGCAQPAVCIPGCDCIPGFFRNKQKECIPAAFCPGTGPGPAQQCPAYEYPVPCIDKCQTCEYKNGNCAQTGECTPGCNCVPGFLRDSTKKCIPASRCP